MGSERKVVSLNTIALSDLLQAERYNEKVAQKFNFPLLCYRKNVNMLSKMMLCLLDNWDKDWEGVDVDKATDVKSKIAQQMVMLRLIGTLQSIRILKLRGYYFESNILTRNFYESLGLCVFLKENPDKVDDWFHGKSDLASSIGIFQLFPKIFGSEEFKQLDKPSRRVYGYLCNYVHSNSKVNLLSVTSIIANGNKKEYALKVPSEPKKEEIEGLPGMSLAVNFAFLYLFENDLTKKQKIKFIRFILKQTTEFLKMAI